MISISLPLLSKKHKNYENIIINYQLTRSSQLQDVLQTNNTVPTGNISKSFLPMFNLKEIREYASDMNLFGNNTSVSR